MPKEILIVDDEPSIVVPIQFLMEQQGYIVLVAENGEDALDVMYKYKPDLILLDIMLPRIDGYEVCEIVRLNPEYRDVKIIFLTAKGREVEIAKGLALGVIQPTSKINRSSMMLFYEIFNRIGYLVSGLFKQAIPSDSIDP